VRGSVRAPLIALLVGIAACTGETSHPPRRATSSPTTSVSAGRLSGPAGRGSSRFIIKARIPFPVPGDVIEGFGSVWVRSWDRRGLLSRIDPTNDRVIARIDVGRPRSVPALAAGEGRSGSSIPMAPSSGWTRRPIR
jgi:hypothetical protein